MLFKLEQKATKKKENTWKINKKNFKTEKTGSKINGKKGTSKRVKNWKQTDLSICIFVAFFWGFFDLLFLLLFVWFFFAFAWKKGKKKQNKSKQKAKKTTKMQMDKSMFFPFFPLFVFPFCFLFSPFILLLCFFDFADLLFGFSFFLHFSRFFSSFKNKNKPWFGEHNTTVVN